jgi:hypothetical protein
MANLATLDGARPHAGLRRALKLFARQAADPQDVRPVSAAEIVRKRL